MKFSAVAAVFFASVAMAVPLQEESGLEARGCTHLACATKCCKEAGGCSSLNCASSVCSGSKCICHCHYG
ncbi:hypothetical protein VFPPC_13535 [Pochonia chlamydosporia 170]|uniref:Uncharacterized protein n=1 Tax=Pochonia chlamydosporia 170 TaxID=1380566 RepID=A0A179F2L0_METCM|nr:hypothetical protein VFPPC_13535 [Pochonia chlamydosporia 170]OAQ59621.1 hypothetical protein VFPPC_13535 [Pochonia chlamydosporia 170]